MPNKFSFDGDIIELTTPFGLLRPEQYDLACDELGELVASIGAGIDARLVSQRSENLEGQEESE